MITGPYRAVVFVPALFRFLALASLAGCASSGGSPAFGPSAAVAPNSAIESGATSAHFTIIVPGKNATAARSRKYVSPATQSLTISIDGATPVAADLTPTSPNCSVPAPLDELTCTASFTVTPGSHSFALATYDALGGFGNELSANSIGANIIAEQANALSVTLAGVPAAIAAVPLPASNLLLGTETAGFSVARGATQSFNATTLDADGNYIIGPGAPTIAATVSGVTNNAAIAVTAATNGNPNQFALSSTGYGSGTLGLTASPASTSAGSPLSVSIPIVSTTISSTFSGVVGGFTQVDGPAGTANFRAPSGTAYDSTNGNFYVVDQGGNMDDGANCAVREITPGGAVTTLAGGAVCGVVDGTGSAAEFAFPNGIAYDPVTNDLYVTDTLACSIRQVTLAGVVTTIAGGFDLAGQEQSLGCGNISGPGAVAQFTDPIGIAYNPTNQTLDVTDSGNCEVRQLTPTGNFTVTTLAGSAPSSTNPGFCPTYTDGTGTAATFNSPDSIAVDPANGNLAVTDDGNCLIRQITSAGVVTTIAGLPPTTQVPPPGNCGYADGVGNKAQFSHSIGGIAFDTKDGTLYVTDALNCAIRQVTFGGTVLTVAGANPSACSLVNGVGVQARFNEPTFPVYVASADSLFLTDYSDGVVRQVRL